MKSKTQEYQLKENINTISKTLLKLTVITLFLSVLSCKNAGNTGAFDYKYSDIENNLKCANVDTQLYHEALMAFEDVIIKTYTTGAPDVRLAYSNFYRRNKLNSVNFQELATPHTMEVFEALKNDPDLWTSNNQPNYNADIFTCIGDNLNDTGLATTYKALISTNSMRPEPFGAPLASRIKTAKTDRYLATYIALDLFYANLFNVDPTKVTENIQLKNAPNSTGPGKQMIKSEIEPLSKTTEDEHAGHNHE